MLFRRILLFILPFLFAGTGSAQLYSYETDNLRLVYFSKGYSYMVPHSARTFENALSFHKKYWEYEPTEKVTIFENDFGDIGNGGTLTIPWNFISIGVAPFEYTFDVMPSNERFQWLMNHELTHTVMTDKGTGSEGFFRSAFSGKVLPETENPISMAYSYLTTPRWYSPRWFHEGIAVFMETWMSGGMGRVLGGYDEMVFRTMVRDSAYFYGVVGLETEGTTIDFQVGVNAYLYGTRFVSYLADTYGMEKLKSFYTRSDTSSRFYASQFSDVFGASVEDHWDEWISHEQDFQKKNLAKIREFPVTPYRRVTESPLGSVSRTWYDADDSLVIAAVNYPGTLAHITALDLHTGTMRRVAEVASPNLYFVTSLAYDDSSNTLFLSDKNSDWRGLLSVNVDTGEEKKLIEYSRTGDFAFNPADKSLWGVQTMDGRAALVTFTPPYTDWKPIYTVPFGKSFFDIDISPDGKYLTGTLAEVTGKQKLIRYRISDLLMGVETYEEVYEFEDNSASNFVHSPDGKYLYGTSYYTGVSNVFRINAQTKEAEILSNSETGFFRPVPIGTDSLLIFDYTTEGLVPGMIGIKPLSDVNAIDYLGQSVISKNPELESYMLPPPSVVPIDSLLRYEGEYNELENMRLAYLYPIVSGYKDFVSYGAHLRFMDPISLSSLRFTASYSPNTQLKQKERLHFSMDADYWDWRLSASLNPTDFYDLFGPTKISRAGYSASLQYRKTISIEKPKSIEYTLRAAFYGDLERLPDYQNVSASFSKLYTFSGTYSYSYMRKSLGAVEEEDGYRLGLNFRSNLANNIFFPKLYFTLEKSLLLPLRNSSFRCRVAAGNAFSGEDSPFANFFFGGFGNNYVDHLAPQRFRELQSMPGFEINELGGRNFLKLSTELNLPPIRFRRVGLLWFYATYTRLSFFASSLFTDLDNGLGSNPAFVSAGAQLDVELVLFSLLKSTLSLGYGRGMNYTLHPKDEFMISLKLL